jgi:integrase
MNKPQKKPTNPESFAMQKRIGSTTFMVNVHFNKEGRETLEEKALRLMKNELNFAPKNATIKPLQAGWLPERGSLYGDEPNWDWFILLVAKTGMRFAEALALTPSDFDFEQQKIKIEKMWKYKKPDGGFGATKNTSSKRTIQVDPQLAAQMSGLISGMPETEPIFVSGRVFNSTVNYRLKILCKKANVPVISVHSLRHTHASLLIFAGVSIASIAKRLGHSSITTTQETYLHIIQELENQDSEKIMQHLSTLC